MKWQTYCIGNAEQTSKNIFTYFIGYKDSEKNRLLCKFRSQMILYKTNFDENRLTYFLTKKEKVFIKYMEILEKVTNISKNKFNSKLIYITKHLKAGKTKCKRRLPVFIYTNNTD